MASATTSTTGTHLSDAVMLHLGVAFGLSKASDDLVRTALAIEF